MLEALRRGASSWVAKGLLGLLVISFAIWGVADVFRGYGQGSLATVGAKEISVEEFQRAYGQTTLPEQPDARRVDEFLVWARRRMVDVP